MAAVSKDPKSRLRYLDHCLGDPDCGRLLSKKRMAELDKERRAIRNLTSKKKT